MKTMIGLFLLLANINSADAMVVKVLDQNGKAVPTAMVTQTFAQPLPIDTSDHGFQKPDVAVERSPEVSGFTDAQGQVKFSDHPSALMFRVRKLGFKDSIINTVPAQKTVLVKLIPEDDLFNLAAAKPANVWLSALDAGDTVQDKNIFRMQCGFCHQQGSLMTRVERTPEDWDKVIKRMIRYGSRLPTDLQKSLPKVLSEKYRLLRENPKLLADPAPWSPALSKVKVTEWAIGTAMSQTHDMLIASNKLVYVADNIQDRLYEIDPVKNLVAVYKIPHKEG
jgi:virginiamycin B lyase